MGKSMNGDLRPGQLVLIGGQLHLIEEVELTITAQQIDPALPRFKKHQERHGWENDGYSPFIVSPTFTKLTGSVDDPVFQSPYFKRLIPQGEPE